MSGLNIPSEFPTFTRGEYLVTKDIDAEDWRTILRAQHREFSEDGSRTPGLWPYRNKTFSTTSTTYTQSNDEDAPDWDVWMPAVVFRRDIQDGAAEVILLEFQAYVQELEIRYTIDAEDGGGTTTSIGTVTLTPSGTTAELVTETLSISAANADSSGSLGNDPRTFTIYAEAKTTDAGGECFADHVHEYRLKTTDTANLPRGY